MNEELVKRLIEPAATGAGNDVVALAPYPAPAPVAIQTLGPPSVAEWKALTEIALTLYKTTFVPGGLRGNKESVLACILAGRELGIGPMQALQGINVIDGRPSMSAELQRALVMRAGHKIVVKEATQEKATIFGVRRDNGAADEVTWTIHDAAKAGLCAVNADGEVVARSQSGKPMPWQQYTRAMLVARASSELVSRLFPEVLAGISYTPDELTSGNEVAPEDVGGYAPVAEEVSADLELARAALKSWAGEPGPRWTQAQAFAQAHYALRIEALDADQLSELVMALKGSDAESKQGTSEGGGEPSEAVAVSEEDAQGGIPSDPATNGGESGSEPETRSGKAAGEGAGPDSDPAGEFAIALSSAARESWTPTPEDLAASGDAAQERLSLLGAAAEVARSMSWGDADIKGRLGGKSRKPVAAQVAALTLLQLRELVDALEAEATKASEG